MARALRRRRRWTWIYKDRRKKKEVFAFHINQREETIDLGGISGALMATTNMQMQTFVKEPVLCLNDQGGERMDVTEGITATLRAGMGGNIPIVPQPFAAGAAGTLQAQEQGNQPLILITMHRIPDLPDR